MHLYQYKLKHSLDKLDKRADEVIYKAYLYELSEEAMLNNLIKSKGASPLLITNGSYTDNSELINEYSFDEQYSKVESCRWNNSNLYISYQKPFSNLSAIEIYSKINLPIMIYRKIEYKKGDVLVIGYGDQPFMSCLMLNEYQVPPLVFMIEADPINIGVTIKYRQPEYMIKKYSTIDLIKSLQSQEATYKEIKKYFEFSGSGINIEQLQQKKQNQIEQAIQNYEAYLQKNNEELLLQSLEKEQDRNNINALVKTLRKTNK